ncbi:MAG: nucleotidyltransferase domain-containing protein [Sulfuricurvum sp.]|uniref:nucleotidyltransferase domain-containing protein n=1 Tax=Sulfuricurvum sp. TaxID=2025608 RepID=UPI002734B4E1|nr:nucleotidyltransferase domain-containing protein [Sulfuricurvum sp.]MDP2851284.1 nucleotidyltransferase domain-containing protein [Sulfuricurvum sp.]
MRISSQTVSVLTELARAHFGASASIRLFGSRTNDLVRGGDIDIQIVAPGSTYRDEIAFLVEVERRLDERVDLRVQRESPLLIDEIAHQEGVLLNGR